MKKILLLCCLSWLLSWETFAQDIQINGTINTPLCFGDANGSIDLLISGGVAPFTYTWSDGSTNQDITNLTAGVFEVTVTDALGSTATDIFVLEEPDLLLGAISSVLPISCFGGSDGSVEVAVYGGTAPYIFQWENGSSEAILSNVVAGTYGLTITDANACTYTSDITIGEPLPMLLDARLYNCESTVGFDGEVNIMATGGTPPYEYAWSDGTTTSNAIRSDLGYGGYSVTVTDANNCVVIIDNVLVCHSSMVLPGSFSLCEFDEAELTTFAPGAISYSWSPIDGLSCSDCPNPIARPTATTNYTVTITSPGFSDFTHNLTVLIDENCIWPGDIDSSGKVSHFDLLPLGLCYGAQGPARYQPSLDWMGQTALDWTTLVPGANIDQKHVDADGDGLLDRIDKLAIEQNWEQELIFSTEQSPYPDIPMFDTLPFYVDIDTVMEGQTLVLPVILGIDDLPGQDIYGLAFSIEYDSSLIVPGSVSMTFEESWLGTIDLDMIEVQKEFAAPGRLDVAIVRTDGNNVSGIGAIGHYIITVEDDILFRNATSSDQSFTIEAKEISFTITNVRIINKDGFQINPYLPTQTGVITGTATGIRPVSGFDDQINIFPNPAQNQIVLNAKSIKLEKFQLLDATGRLIREEKIEGQSSIVDVSELPNGTYWVRVESAAGIYCGKLVVLR